MTKVSGLKLTSAVVAALSLAALHGCGGDSKKKDTDGGGNAPSFADCVTNTAPIAQDRLFTANSMEGAQLYDDMFDKLFVSSASDQDHPLWTPGPGNTISGGDTWRCKNCHGWDYQGVDGAYGPQNTEHYTGVEGVLEHVNANRNNPANIYCAISSGTDIATTAHSQVDELIAAGATQAEAEQAMWNLTAFLVEKVIDTTAYIAPNGGIIGGNATNGETLFGDAGCDGGRCHGRDGSVNADDVGLGAIASEDPWEFLHKTRFGDTHYDTMPAFETDPATPLTLQDILDIATYAQQSLTGGNGIIPPDSNGGGGPVGPTSSVVRGGLLYDNHFEELGRTTAVNNPLWAAQTTNTRTGVDTWRCKECHGWDYKGKDGVYGDLNNSHYTGFPGIFGTRFTNADEAFTYLKFGFRMNLNGISTLVHAFGTTAGGAPLIQGSPAMSDADLRALADFVINGLVDTNMYVLNSIGQKAAIGDPTKGLTLYNNTATSGGQCVSCHGIDGKLIDFNAGATPPEYLGTLAVDNPWETLHKIRFGQPNSEMPSTVEKGLPTQSAADILRYTQELPTL